MFRSHRHLTAALLLAGAVFAHAEDKTAIENLCAKNPERCEQIRAKAKEQCAADPVACEKRMALIREHAAELKAQCEADPAACEQRKAELRERLKQHQDSQ